MSLVDGIKVKAGKTVKFKTTPPATVITYRGFHLIQVGTADPDLVTEWTPSEMEAGVSFVKGSDTDVIVVRVQSSAAGKMGAGLEYQPPPPAAKPYSPNVRKGLQSLEWVFLAI